MSGNPNPEAEDRKAPGRGEPPTGLLVVDKPEGCTSHDVVARLRRVLGIRRIGHAGTLDPHATGVLLVCVGQATRIVEYLMERPKVYRVRMKLGEETDTEDASGRLTQRREVPPLGEREIGKAVAVFVGEIRQVPPMYSALKKKGRRLYDLARKGEEVARDPRTVTIYGIGNLGCDLPYVTFDVRCSKGTYVRSLCRDIGRKLGPGAHLTDLRRIETAGFTEERARTLVEIEGMDREGARGLLLPMEAGLGHMPRVAVRAAAIPKVCRGQSLAGEDLEAGGEGLRAGDLVQLCRGDAFLAVGRGVRDPRGGPAVRPVKVFCRER